jgi:hypothetical protein
MALNADLVQGDHLEPADNLNGVKNIQEFGVEAANNPTADASQKKLCRMCNKHQPLRTKHCHECEKCVLTYDHHCVFFHNCVGEKNRPFFYFYLLLLSLQSLIATLLIESQFSLDFLDYGLLSLFALFMAQFTMIATLFIFHNYLMCRGLTTWEYFAEDVGAKCPYSKGCAYNLKMYWQSGFLGEPAAWVVNT